MSKIIGLSPLADKNSRLLILGTMPGVRSLNQGEYYANPQNQFWKIVSHIFSFPATASYTSRKSELLKQGISLWDVIRDCERSGSGDKEIRNPKANDIERFLAAHPKVQRIAFNGNAAKLLAERLIPALFTRFGCRLHVLPSTSPANTHTTLSEKTSQWRKVLEEEAW